VSEAFRRRVPQKRDENSAKGDRRACVSLLPYSLTFSLATSQDIRRRETGAADTLGSDSSEQSWEG
jgi:hypothetical protein